MMKFSLFSFIWYACSIFVVKSNDPPGHLMPFGSHAPPIQVDSIDTIPDPTEFNEKYMSPGTPVIMKGAAKKFENFKLWKDDEYIREKYGNWLLNVDVGKYEGSVFGRSAYISMNTFLNHYKQREYYLINEVVPDNPMREEISLLKPMACGGYADLITAVLLLFSSGATKSAMHWDDVENIHCVLDGTKEWMLYDRELRDRLPIMDDQRAYVAIDCRSVDMYKYPVIQELPWHRAFLDTGDCLFLPHGWAHHVKSEGNERNMALAVWFGPVHKQSTNMTDCPDDLTDLPEVFPLGRRIISQLKNSKQSLYLLFEDDDQLPKEKFIDAAKEIVNETEAYVLFNKYDSDKNDVITSEEVEALSVEDFPEVVPFKIEEKLYQEIGGLPHRKHKEL